jgi:glyoxylase-like metal-dependent hydrolase (beta-lactamase superfamily II)
VISFSIVGNDFALMFDTGLGIGNMRNVVDQLTDLDIVVLNSHTHYDHIGTSQSDESESGCDNGIASVGENAADAQVVDV